MYAGGGSFPSLHKCSRNLFSLLAHYQGSLYPWVQGLHFNPGPDTQILPELCCRHTLAPSCALLSQLTHWFFWMLSSPFCCSWLDPLGGLRTQFITSPWLELSIRPCYAHPDLPIQLRCCRTVPWLGRYCLCWGHRQCTPVLLMVQLCSCCSLTLTTTVMWQGPSPQHSLASEKPPVKSPGIFNLLAPVTSGNNSSKIHEGSAI